MILDSPLIVAEPVGRYASRSPLVVDCSVLAAVLFDEPRRDEAALVMTGRALFAPDLINHEMLSVALKKLGTRNELSVFRSLADLAELDLKRYQVDSLSQFKLARHTGLTAYDAAYLQLALDLEAPLATFDKALGEAAEALFIKRGNPNESQ